jgi:hypothetical protein
MSLIALHEAAHATIAAILPDMTVVRVVAAGTEPHCRTRWLRPRTREQEISVLRRLAMIDLAGAAVEDEPGSPAAATDRENAFHRCRRVIALEDGVEAGQLDEIQLADVSALYNHLTDQAMALVRDYWPVIGRVAHRLADMGELSGAAVDAIILETSDASAPM